ncbi:MAG: response regulator transcription factor [Flavipsychrobacter sp.]|nr:response regulator transcription factor [Flavipsychrobacter sp.]
MPKNDNTPKSVAITDTPLISVAIAEKNELVRAGLVSLLTATGKYKVIMQDDSDVNLLVKFEKSKHLPLICMVDINTLTNNYEGIRRVKYDYPKVKVLALVEQYNTYTLLNLLRSEVNGIISINESAKELEKALSEIHTKGHYYNKHVTKELADGVRYRDIRVPDVTRKQQKFMELISSNLSYSEIAQKLGVGVRTVDGYRDLLFEKFNLQNRTDLVLFSLKTGLVRLENTISTEAGIVKYREPEQQEQK